MLSLKMSWQWVPIFLVHLTLFNIINNINPLCPNSQVSIKEVPKVNLSLVNLSRPFPKRPLLQDNSKLIKALGQRPCHLLPFRVREEVYLIPFRISKAYSIMQIRIIQHREILEKQEMRAPNWWNMRIHMLTMRLRPKIWSVISKIIPSIATEYSGISANL